MSVLWVGPLALAGGAAAALALVVRSLRAERDAAERSTERLRAMRPAVAEARRRTSRALPPGLPGSAPQGQTDAP